MKPRKITLGWKNKRKGKSRILTHGPDWMLIKIEEQIICMGDAKGPWGLIESLKTGDIRWIHLTNDPNFVVL